ncbi:MAG TPA: hypothetical protein DC054_20150 [Blastocatellia bacterium]|nr:hypothetical protein [Blastocatellia bacterium]
MARYGQVANYGHRKQSPRTAIHQLAAPRTWFGRKSRFRIVLGPGQAWQGTCNVSYDCGVELQEVIMLTRITQINKSRSETAALEGGDNIYQPDSCHPESVARDAGTAPTVFKVEGTLHLPDAELLERLCRDVSERTKQPVTLELDGLSYLDSDSAAVLCRMKREQNVSLNGLHLFIEKVVELTEECEKAAKYLPKPKRPVE